MDPQKNVKIIVGDDYLLANDLRIENADLAQVGLVVVKGGLTLLFNSMSYERAREHVQMIVRGFAQNSDFLTLIRVYDAMGLSLYRGLGIRVPNTDGDVGRVPPLGGMPEALYSAAVVVGVPPLKDQDTGYQPQQMKDQSEHLAACSELQRIHEEGGTRVQRHLAPLARQGEIVIREVYKMTEPFLPNNSELSEATAPMQRWIVDPVTRAQDTRHMMDKARAEITQEVTKDAEARGREQGRNEILSMLDEQLRSMLTGAAGTTDKGSKK